MTGMNRPIDQTRFTISRRTLLGGVATASTVGLSGCVTPGWQSPGPPSAFSTISFWLRRAQDQLELKFTFTNAIFGSTWHRPFSIRKVDTGLPLIVRIDFPPQHVLERAFFEDAGNTDPPSNPPVESTLSGASRLVFEVPIGNDGRFPLTERALLNWSDWTPLLVPDVVPKASIAPPGPLETAIELPTKLIL